MLSGMLCIVVPSLVMMQISTESPVRMSRSLAETKES